MLVLLKGRAGEVRHEGSMGRTMSVLTFLAELPRFEILETSK